MNDTRTDELQALAEKWERRLAATRVVGWNDVGLGQAHELTKCIKDLRAYLESAGQKRESRDLPAVSSGEWVDALRAISASVEGIRERAERWGNMDMALDAAGIRASLVNLRRQIESASTGGSELRREAREANNEGV